MSTVPLDPAANGRVSEAFDIGKCLGWGWQGLKAAGLTMWLGGFLMNCTSGGGSGSSGYSPSGDDTEPGELPDFSQYVPDFSDPETLAIAALVVVAIGMLVLFATAIQAWLEPGWIKAQQAVLETGDAGVELLFSGGSHFAAMFQWKLLSMLIRFGVGVATTAPGGVLLALGVSQQSWALGGAGVALIVLLAGPATIWLSLGLMLGSHAVVLDDAGPREALERSWALAAGNRLTLFFVGFAYGVVSMVATVVGIMMLCIGVLFTAPAARAVTNLAITAGYLRATRGLEVGESWALKAA